MALRYGDALAFLDGLIHPAAHGVAPARPRPEWERRLATMRWLMGALGEPQHAFRTVHIAGTSGKGSTATLVAAALQQAGYRVGLHTSPYLQSPREKILMNAQPVTQADFAAGIDRLRAPLENLRAAFPGYQPTYVQASTALALQHFAAAGVDIAVVEASMGGRFDFTNVLAPLATVITNVGLDHEATIGPGLRGIAWHKAGIIKASVPVITGTDDPEALAVIQTEARAARAPILRLGHDFWTAGAVLSGQQPSFDWLGSNQSYRGLRCGLPGAFQVANAALAVAAVEVIRQRGFDVPEAALRAGLRQARMAGRFETVQAGPPVILDGAHNGAKADQLRRALDATYPGAPVALVLGVGAAKDAAAIVSALAPRCRQVICTEAATVGKPAMPAAALAGIVAGSGARVMVVPNPEAAVDQALGLADRGVVCVTGSLYLVGRVRERWSPSIDAGRAAAVPAASG